MPTPTPIGGVGGDYGGPGWVCPTGQAAVSFSDTWGAPRSGGRRHEGVDMIGTEGTPVVDVPLKTGPASEVRVVMTARQGGYLTLSAIEVYAKSPGASSDAAAESVEVSGKPIPSFAPDTTTYRVVTDAPSRSRVTATAHDPYATVAVDRLDEHGGTVAVVTVTSEDGVRTRTYRIQLVRR